MKTVAALQSCHPPPPLTALRGAARQTRKMVHLKHKQTGMSLEQAVDELQKDFEVAMEAVVSAIRQKHGVSEPQMTQVLMEYQADAEVQTSVQTLRDVRPRHTTNPQPLWRHIHSCARTKGDVTVRPWGRCCISDSACLSSAQAMSGKAPPKAAEVPQEPVKPRRHKPRQRKG